MDRRAFVARAVASGLGAALSGGLGATLAQATTPLTGHPEALTGLLAYALPGDDAYSRAQGLAYATPGGPSDGALRSLRRTLDEAVTVPVPGQDKDLPGALAIAVLLDLTAAQIFPFVRGPFRSHFCNLRWKQKALVLRALELTWRSTKSPVGWMTNQLPLLAAFCASGEAGGRLRADGTIDVRPAIWELADWDGVLDGAPERRGYYRGRTAAEATTHA